MLVSVITPTYNRESFLPEAIDSVLNQTYKNFELLIVDDGSTDKTNEVLQAYASADHRVKYFYQENQGQSIARNLAIANAKGDVICFLDSDNYWPLDKLQKQVDVMKRSPEADVVYGDAITIDELGNEISRSNMTRHSGNICPELIKDNFVSMNTTMVRMNCFEVMGGMSGKRKVADDYDLWLRLSAKFHFKYVPEYWAYYRVMKDQISSNKQLRFDTNEAIIFDFLNEFPDALSRKQKNAGLAAFYCRKSRHFSSVGDRTQALRALRCAYRYQPMSVSTWRTLFRTMVPSAK